MRVRAVLEKAVKELPRLDGDGLNDLLRWYLIQSDAGQWQLSRKEAFLLILTLIVYDIPPPSVLKLTSSSELNCHRIV